jgi:hypothetical protein
VGLSPEPSATTADRDEVWTTPLEAGGVVGKSDQTVLRWIHSGTDLEPWEYRQNGQFYEVLLAAVRRVAETKQRPRGKRKLRTGSVDAEVLSGGIETHVNDDAVRLRTQLKEVQQHLQEVIDERDRLRVENRKLRDTATDLHSALERWIGPRE